MINSVWRSKRLLLALLGVGPSALALAVLPALAHAQPSDLPVPPATTTSYPPGVVIIDTLAGPAYGSKKRQTLYGLDMRTVLRAGPDPALYCTGQCAKDWVPMLAPKGAAPNILFPPNPNSRWQPPQGFVSPVNAPDWTIIKGAQGPQWVYKGWHLVFTRKGEKRGVAAQDGAEGKIWNMLRFVPPVPNIVAPATVRPVFAKGRYMLVEGGGRALFTGNCAANCSGWKPFAGGMASAGIGDWKVRIDSEIPQWTFQGLPVFVSDDADVPEGGKAIMP